MSKLYQNVCKILYKILSIKQIIFNKYATNLKTTISQRSLSNLGLLPLLFEYWSRDTKLPLVGVLVTWYGRINNIINYILSKWKLLNLNNDRSKPKLLRLLREIVVFRLVAHLLNIMYLNLLILYKISYIDFHTKELSFCHKLKSSDSNIFAIFWCKPLLFQT